MKGYSSCYYRRSSTLLVLLLAWFFRINITYSEEFQEHRVTRQRRARDTYRDPEMPEFSVLRRHGTRGKGGGKGSSSKATPIDSNTSHSPSPSGSWSKSTKKSSSKSTKKSTTKSTKKSSKREGGQEVTLSPSQAPLAPSTPEPTMLPSTSPTSAPTSPVAITLPPTSEFAFTVEPDPYALLYTFGGSGDIITTSEDFVQLGEVTRLFLEDYLFDVYANTLIIVLEDVLTSLVGFSEGELPLEAVYSSAALFSEGSIFYPPLFEIEQEIQDAFTDPVSKKKYLNMVKTLPTGNAFRVVTNVEYAEFDGR